MSTCRPYGIGVRSGRKKAKEGSPKDGSDAKELPLPLCSPFLRRNLIDYSFAFTTAGTSRIPGCMVGLRDWFGSGLRFRSFGRFYNPRYSQ